MATIRKRGSGFQVQIRRIGQKSTTKSFITKQDANIWARQTEVLIDKNALPPDPTVLKNKLSKFTSFINLISLLILKNNVKSRCNQWSEML